jgi:hypothetical protein
VAGILARIIEASPCGLTHYFVTQYGKPFTDNGFGNWFRDRCYEAGLSHCTAYGLRKCGATIAAENGATVNQLMAIYDWSTPAQAKIYTDKADRKHIARTHGGTQLELLTPPFCYRCVQVGQFSGRRSGGTRTPNPRFWRPVL